jgi:Ras-related protein Rab-5C
MTVRKIMLLGEIGVGKTSIARRLTFDVWDGIYKATIGTDVYRYEVTPSPTADPFHFIIWDTDGNMGDSIFKHVYVKQAHAALIIGDCMRRTTLDHMVKLGQGFMDALPGRPLTYVVNKTDALAPGETIILPPELQSGEFPVVKTSAKTGEHVRETFHDLAATIHRRGG